MNPATGNLGRREQVIAGLLWYGTLLASAVIGAGMAFGLLQHLARPHGSGLGALATVKVGVALLILLPVARVVLMLIIFLRERDYAYVAISALVLATIATGVVAGL